MKTSNKILLGTFLIALLILVSVHVALYAKYKRGDYTLVSDDMWPTNMITYSLSDIKYVSVNNVENVTIHAADSSKLRYDKPGDDEDNFLEVNRRNDTLFLFGKSKRNANGRWYRGTALFFAGPLPVRITNSNLHIYSRENVTSKSFPLDVTLDQASMVVNNQQNNEVNIASVKIDASNGSRISLFKVKTNFLDVHLKNSSLEENTLNADSIMIVTDASSKIQLSGKNSIKAKILAYE